jgi:hypothetical protein
MDPWWGLYLQAKNGPPSIILQDLLGYVSETDMIVWVASV